MEKAINRFFFGGILGFTDMPNGEERHLKIPKFDIKLLITLFRSSIVERDDYLKYSDESEEMNRILRSMNMRIPHDLVKAFIHSDSLLHLDYIRFKRGNWLSSTKFFDGERVKKNTKSFRFSLKDAACVRILEASGYIKVPDQFYGTISSEWKME